MSKVQIKPVRPVFPSPAGLVTSVDAEGRPNIITLGEIFNISIREPVIVGIAIAKPRYSHALISASKEFVVNLPTADMVATVDHCGMVSGRNVDKFAAYGLTALPAAEVAAPLIAECPVNIECRVLSVQEIGDHDLFAGEVVAVHVDEDGVTPDGTVSTSSVDPLCFMNWEYWTTGQPLGRIGFTRRE
ncbi:MAG: flavin reductase family protein [Lentisphaerae bacterium]|nr:flavin reductase family protein [Lentisphaerota bacterium]MBT4823376.1 flavin reductase family protein [Lentisphaerota bacterium]MBT5608165.1 flavin reductase family protein [Lentisphaerota bacterium]MBT7058713.1 flavin reductase family protein [Lentisphaerota bacterium]MBT7847657.1 flavin reductase family protein [Lentisphaerota bacterium]